MARKIEAAFEECREQIAIKQIRLKQLTGIFNLDSLVKKIHLPTDFGVTKSIDSGIRLDKEISEFSDDDIGVDISERTVKEFASILVTSNTVFWNGPMGIFEVDNFKLGTQSITEIVSNLEAYTVVGGGDSVSAIRIFSDLSKFNHISTGGGASLKYLQGNELPGVNIYKPLIL